MVEALPSAHSPLGGSGAYRWLVCPGSVSMAIALEDAGYIDEESEFAKEGTAAHAVSEECLIEGCESWELVGEHYDGDQFWHPTLDADVLTQAFINDCTKVTAEMTGAVGQYIEALENWHPKENRHQGNTWIERRFHCPSLHELYYGAADFVYLEKLPDGTFILHIWDYKHGAGIVIEVPRNPQLMYYGCGVLEDLDLWRKVDKVVLHVAQPRGWHFLGPMRHWETTPEELEEWLDDVCLPGMERALVSRDTKSGSHCRFCPVRSFACPQLVADMKELEELMENMQRKRPNELTNNQVNRFLELWDIGKIVWKAAEKTAFVRISHGRGKGIKRKLVNKRANRAYKDPAKARARLRRKYGDKAFTKPELKSPAEIDALPGGQALTAELASKPNTGLTLAPLDDNRAEVSKSTKSMFKPVGKAKTTRKKGA